MATIKKHHKRASLLTLGSRSHQRTRLLFKAVEFGNVSKIKELLKKGGLQINARSPAGETLLQVAVFFGRCITIIRCLVRAGCRINSADTTGDTALHIAVRYHNIQLAVELIRLGANVRAKNDKGETPLQVAVANKSHVDLLKEMIPNGERLSEMDFYGLYSLHLATAPWRPRNWIPSLVTSYDGETIYGDKLHGLVKMLLDAGADVNARDTNGCSPIQCAVYTGDLELVKALIDAGADLDNRNDLGATALHDAVLCCNEAMVHLLLSRGAGVNIETEHVQDTALHWASQLNKDNSHTEIIKKLVEFGSDLDHERDVMETPFQQILRLADVDLVTFFIDEHKADLNKLLANESNSLAQAAQNVDERVMDLVLQRSTGLKIDHKCVDQETPLHNASRLSLPKNVRRLISRGADVNAKDCQDQTPLYHCVFGPNSFDESTDERANYRDERMQVIRLLLECGADVNHVNSTTYRQRQNNQTVFELAIALSFMDEAWKMIIEYVAEVEVRTNEPLFDERNLRAIVENPEVENYYRKCQAELASMRTTKIEGSSVSYLSLLTQQLDVVVRYTRNGELVKNLLITLQSDAYPIYAPQLKKKFDAASARQKRIDRAFTVLSETLQFADLNDSILKIIFKHLSEHDITLLIGCA